MSSPSYAQNRLTEQTLTGVPWQRCQIHLAHDAMSYVVKPAMRGEVAESLRAVCNAPDRPEAERQLEIVQHQPPVVLSGEVRCDEVYVVAGHKGKPDTVEKKVIPPGGVG